ncbi:MAG: hypothetical protein ACRDZ8_18950 [Acidimicrobiales bacterium]
MAATGQIERVRPNPAFQAQQVDAAKKNLQWAERMLDDNPLAALSNAYDAGTGSADVDALASNACAPP